MINNLLFYFIFVLVTSNGALLGISLKSYIQQNYVILYQSPALEKIEDAEYFFLAEQHDLIGHKHIHSRLINQYSSPNDIVLVEGVPSGDEIKPKQSLQSVWIAVPVDIQGWDAGWLKDITGIDTSEIEYLGAKLLQIQYNIIWNQAHRKKEYFRLVRKLAPLMQHIQPLFNKEFEETIINAFPSRVEAMIQTLSTISQRKVFIIAGIYHLYQDPSLGFSQYPKLSLEAFYAYIKDKKALILFPKESETTYWNNIYQIK